MGLSNLQNNNAASIENDFAATNFSHQNNTQIKSIRERTFTSTGAKEITDNDFDQSNTSELYKFSTLYNANPDFQFEYDIFYRKADESEYSDLTSSATRIEDISSLVGPITFPNRIYFSYHCLYFLWI